LREAHAAIGEKFPMNDIKIGEHDLLTFLRPDTLWGALIYFVIFVALASLIARGFRAAAHASLTSKGHVDRTTISFLQQFGSVLIWVVVIILYAHLIPALRSMGTALLAGAGVVSVVLGLAAQSTLGNLVAGISIAIYRPFRLGATLQVTAPTGTDIGVVELISLGYTTLRAPDGHMIVLPNAIAASQVTINLNTTYAPWPITLTIRLSRDADIDAARQLALSVAAEIAGQQAVVGCFLTKIDAATITLELRFKAADAAGRDALRSKILTALPRRFAEAKIGSSGTELPAFS
jgi:small conductance mechanosensitive channel